MSRARRGGSPGETPIEELAKLELWIADAHRDDGKRFVVHADEKLTAFVELESAHGKRATTCFPFFLAAG